MFVPFVFNAIYLSENKEMAATIMGSSL